jgi:hypothetical protein
LTLHELLKELENPDEIPKVPDGIILFPPEKANDDVTDEDSGDEDVVAIENLPASQLQMVAELENVNDDLDNDPEDDIPLSQLRSGRGCSSRTKRCKVLHWSGGNISEEHFPGWMNQIFPNRQLTPLEYFELFFDEEIMDIILAFKYE